MAPGAADDRGRKRRTYLPAILDDATRVIPYARLSFADDTSSFLLVLREAITRRGLAARPCVDNGSSFRSRQPAMICARLGIALLHARPHHRRRKGKNRGIHPHGAPNRPSPRSTRRTSPARSHAQPTVPNLVGMRASHEPASRPRRRRCRSTDGHAPQGGSVVPIPGIDLERMFLFEVGRKVAKARTVSLHNRIREVDPVLQGQDRHTALRPRRTAVAAVAGVP